MEDIDVVLSCVEDEHRHTVDPKDALAVSTSAKDDRNHCILHAGHNIQEGDREAGSRHDPVYCSRELRLQALGYRMLQRCSLLLQEKHEWEGTGCSIDHQDENGAAAVSLSREVGRRHCLLPGDPRKEDNNLHFQLGLLGCEGVLVFEVVLQ